MFNPEIETFIEDDDYRAYRSKVAEANFNRAFQKWEDALFDAYYSGEEEYDDEEEGD